MTSFRRLLNNPRGFTLLEVMIALAIMMVAFAAIIAVESGAIDHSTRARQMNLVAMLAKNTMVETEYALQGKPFDEVKKEEGGSFAAPYEEYRWERKIKEVEFPKFQVGGGGKKDSGSEDSGNGAVDQITKVLTNYLSKALREVSVTIFYKRGNSEQKFTVTTYWVDLNHEFSPMP